MKMSGMTRKTILPLFAVAVCGLTGCNIPPDKDDPVAAYEYAELWKDEAETSFYWMHESAIRKYPPAMKALSWYYVTGCGTEKNYRKAAEWILRYTENSPSGKEGMKVAKAILAEETNAQSTEGLILLVKMIQLEARQNRENSSEVQEAVELLTKKMEELCEYWLKHSSPEKAFEVVEYCWKAAEEYPAPFPEDFFATVERLLKKIKAAEKPGKTTAGAGKNAPAAKPAAAKPQQAKKEVAK